MERHHRKGPAGSDLSVASDREHLEGHAREPARRAGPGPLRDVLEGPGLRDAKSDRHGAAKTAAGMPNLAHVARSS
jgi:hypothetical protein